MTTRTISASALASDPLRHQLDNIFAMTFRVFEIVRAGNHVLRLILRTDGVKDLARIGGKDPHVGVALHDERGLRDLREVFAALALRRLEAPHRKPGPERIGAADAGKAVGLGGMAAIATGARALRRIERRIHEP